MAAVRRAIAVAAERRHRGVPPSLDELEKIVAAEMDRTAQPASHWLSAESGDAELLAGYPGAAAGMYMRAISQGGVRSGGLRLVRLLAYLALPPLRRHLFEMSALLPKWINPSNDRPK
jgi:hypothetical protein